jgi:hypothetical protein
MTTPADIITTARTLYNDADSVLYRKPDSELLGYINEGMQEISALNAALFTTIGDLLCTPGEVEQAVTFADAQALVKVLRIHGGNALTMFDMDAMDAFAPAWATDTAGPAVQWSRLPGDPLRFFIYPKAPVTAQTLDIAYVRNPTTLALADTITEVPSAFFPALVDYVVYRCESADDEHANSGRAAAHYKIFTATVKGT